MPTISSENSKYPADAKLFGVDSDAGVATVHTPNGINEVQGNQHLTPFTGRHKPPLPTAQQSIYARYKSECQAPQLLQN